MPIIHGVDMIATGSDDTQSYVVLMNEQVQYPLWPPAKKTAKKTANQYVLGHDVDRTSYGVRASRVRMRTLADCKFIGPWFC